MLLGTLLVGILVAHRKHVAQIRGAEKRLGAIRAADDLLAQWSADGSWGATKDEGRFDGRDDLIWRWVVTSTPDLARVHAAVGRLEVADPQGLVLARIELLTPETTTR
jgi:hypothetical protein